MLPSAVAVPLTDAASLQGASGSGSLRTTAAAQGLLFGCEVSPSSLVKDPAYAALVVEQCNLLTSNATFDWMSLRPSNATYSFDQADRLIAFGEAHNVKVRGGGLTLESRLPPWFHAQVRRDNAKALLAEHVDQVVGRYAGRMHSWGVAADVVDADGGRGDGLRDNLWLRLVGADYLEFALGVARRAVPQALLTLSMSGVSGNDRAAHDRRLATLLLLRRLRARQAPLDGVEILLEDRSEPQGTPRAHETAYVAFLADLRELDLQVILSGAGEHAFRQVAVACSLGAVRAVISTQLTPTAEQASPAANDDPLFDRQGLPTPSFFRMRQAIAESNERGHIAHGKR